MTVVGLVYHCCNCNRPPRPCWSTTLAPCPRLGLSNDNIEHRHPLRLSSPPHRTVHPAPYHRKLASSSPSPTGRTTRSLPTSVTSCLPFVLHRLVELSPTIMTDCTDCMAQEPDAATIHALLRFRTFHSQMSVVWEGILIHLFVFQSVCCTI